MTTSDMVGRIVGTLGPAVPRRALTGALVLATAAFTAYYTTVSGIELALAGKADRSVVEDIQQRLIAIETLLRTDVAHRDDFAALREELQRRLTRIETLLDPGVRGPSPSSVDPER